MSAPNQAAVSSASVFRIASVVMIGTPNASVGNGAGAPVLLAAPGDHLDRRRLGVVSVVAELQGSDVEPEGAGGDILCLLIWHSVLR